MKNPLVSVICLCYNQGRFVKEALDSVISQSYPEVQLIIVDDGSKDRSKEEIRKWLANRTNIPFIDCLQNLGSTTAFNKGLELAQGKYVIDLAADDIMDVDRVVKQVDFFEKQKSKTGVIYSNGQYIDEEGQALKLHFENTRLYPYQGDVYKAIIDTYFIPTPTMMIRKEVLDQLGGYDETLAYEDFDFWVRSARNWEYAYQDEVLTSIRIVKGSQSQGYSQKGDSGMISTLKVCRKIARLNQTQDENRALVNRIKYEIRQAFLAGKKRELGAFFDFWQTFTSVDPLYLFFKYVGILGLRLVWLRKLLK